MRNASSRQSLSSASLVASGMVTMLASTAAQAQMAPGTAEPDDPGPTPAADPAPAPAPAEPAAPPAPSDPTPLPAAAVAPVATAAAPEAAPPATYPSMGKGGEIKLSDTTWVRIGVQAQTWASFQQSPTVQADGQDGGYSRDLFFRRARVLLAAQLAKIGEDGSVSAMLNLESSNLGKAAPGPPDAMMNPTAVKTDGSVRIFDGFGEMKFANELAVDAGMMLIPLSRNILQSTVTYLGLDFGATSAVMAGTTIGNTGRDLGFQLKG